MLALSTAALALQLLLPEAGPLLARKGMQRDANSAQIFAADPPSLAEALGKRHLSPFCTNTASTGAVHRARRLGPSPQAPPCSTCPRQSSWSPHAIPRSIPGTAQVDPPILLSSNRHPCSMGSCISVPSRSVPGSRFAFFKGN